MSLPSSLLSCALLLALAGAVHAQSQSGAPVDRASGNGSMGTGEGIELPDSRERDADSPTVPSSEQEMRGETLRDERTQPQRDVPEEDARPPADH